MTDLNEAPKKRRTYTPQERIERMQAKIEEERQRVDERLRNRADEISADCAQLAAAARESGLSYIQIAATAATDVLREALAPLKDGAP